MSVVEYRPDDSFGALVKRVMRKNDKESLASHFVRIRKMVLQEKDKNPDCEFINKLLIELDRRL